MEQAVTPDSDQSGRSLSPIESAVLPQVSTGGQRKG